MSILNEGIEKMQEYINWEKLERYLRSSISNLPNGKMEVQKFSEGYSNLTYLLRIDEWEGVLRRPPFGKVPPKAHDMEREYRMLEKVNPVFSFAPKPYVFHEDQDIMNKHFYVMEKKQGVVIDDKLPEDYGSSESAGPLISKNIIETLVQLQSIDYKKAGLENMGKPEGFMERQVTGWIKRYELSKTEDIRYLQELQDWLVTKLPKKSETTIVHNDFKLNNMVLDAKHPGKMVGVLDWELSTIGDPLSDLGSTVAYWGQAEDLDMGINIITNQSGFYSRREFIETYAKLSGRDVSEISYYVTFGFYKLAVILQQIHYRWKNGSIKDERFGTLNDAVKNLVEMANLTRSNQLL
ncbi:phosphotransferase family protein [Psychrobacillus sp. OK032]|uniref:phosphotransferase family protein n=1 Tax=Psychrobacillus sp. OK032 TaxID=1884358 RepID=UPI0008B728FB|nr:phosphotransferase family protein [Psychrobacillus sp. OK032]SER67739.1 Predicted kinase, aminoglycoside phosphotransferase (APT) family [Psychrobacillus sp. OK032]